MAKKVKVKKQVPLVGIVGLGYVGLPLAREFCKGGARVLGFDINTKNVANINKGKSPLKHIPNKDAPSTHRLRESKPHRPRRACFVTY